MADMLKEDTVWISIPLDGETVERLRSLADDCHADPVKVAGALLHDMLKDDEEANLPSAVGAGSVTFN